MYFSLCLSAFLGLCLSLLAKDLNDDMIQLLFIVIFAQNFIYVLLWTYKVIKFTLKHMSMSEKFVGLHAYLTCFCLSEQPEDTKEDKV